jgi:hypothetical protein
MQELRRDLDKFLEYQANEAPSMSLEHAQYPGGGGDLVAFLYEREMNQLIADEEAKEDDLTDEMTRDMEETALHDS